MKAILLIIDIMRRDSNHTYTVDGDWGTMKTGNFEMKLPVPYFDVAREIFEKNFKEK